VAVLLVQVADGDECVHALAARLADADQEARRERDAELPGQRDRPQPPRRDLVGRPIVRHAARQEPLRHRLEHDAHAHVHLAQRRQIALAHQPRVGVGQERRFREDRRAHRAQVRECRAVTVTAQELAMTGERRLWPVAEREQRFLGAQSRSRLREGHDLVRLHRVGAGLARIAAKRAVAAVVTAQGRQRHEHLGREGHGAPAPTVAQLAGPDQQLVQRRRRRVDERARVLMRDHARRFAAFFFGGVFDPARDDAAALRPPAARESFGRTSLAKRSMFARTARSSCTVWSKTKCETPSAW
jgi:hypothetical protein